MFYLVIIVLIEDNGKFETQFKLLFDAEVEFSKKEKEYEDAIVALEDKFDNEEIDKSLYNKEKEKIEKNLEKAEKILEKVSIKVSKIEEKLSKLPTINVPAITFDGQDDEVRSPSPESFYQSRFTGFRKHQILPGVGHNIPQETPNVVAKAILELSNFN